MKKALVLYSGGQDSAVCLALALEHYHLVETVGFDYGQRHIVEMQTRQILKDGMLTAFPQWSSRLGLDHILDLRGFGSVSQSALTEEKAIEMTEKGLPSSFVPGRNLAFLVYAAALADRRGIDILVAGMGEADYSGYPDCREMTLNAQITALRLGIERPFVLETPLMHLDKKAIWAMAFQIGGQALVDLIVEESHSCYLGHRHLRHDWGYGCGTCPACDLRGRSYDAWLSDRKKADNL